MEMEKAAAQTAAFDFVAGIEVQRGCVAVLNFVPGKDVVLLAAGTPRAAQATHQEHRNARSDYEGQEAPARDQPLDQCMHNPDPFLLIPNK
jgi:hypothetical protein